MAAQDRYSVYCSLSVSDNIHYMDTAMNDELIDSLNKLADWIEKDNHIYSDSIPRRAATVINRLEIENAEMRILLGRDWQNPWDMLTRAINRVRLAYYLWKKRK